MLSSNEIRQKFLDFFEKRGHKILPSASLVPENDPSVLFNTAGMQPLVPYLMGQKHPMGTRLANIQKCVRTGDLDDIGDNRHFSFFEMMGNWSLSDYFKEDAIKWSYEFLTNPSEGLGLDPKRLYVTCFEGDENAGKDIESANIWQNVGIPENRIYFLPAEDNWWSPGDNGPCGPCSEMFYDMSGAIGDLSKEEFIEAVRKEDVIEIWNDVFMEYEKKDEKVIGKLAQKNVDTGAGLERITAVMQGKKTAYDTDLFEYLFNEMDTTYGIFSDIKSKRIVADHIRTAVFMINDGIIPSNKDKGYVLRRLIRRAISHARRSATNFSQLFYLVDFITNHYKNFYPEFEKNRRYIHEIFKDEELSFSLTLERGLKEFEKGTDAFMLFTSYGFPYELTEELLKEKGKGKITTQNITGKSRIMSKEDFNAKMAEHQKLSQTASAGMFKGGLANHNEETVKLHTAHHLLLAALQQVLGKSVKQRGSNITEERLRIDFTFDRKMTDEEKQKVEDIVNEKIKAGLSVIRKEMPLTEAEKLGAEMEFGAKYPEIVSVYFIGDDEAFITLDKGEGQGGGIFSIEFCGGPHINNTNELGTFKIQKEEAVSAGVRRIKAILM